MSAQSPHRRREDTGADTALLRRAASVLPMPAAAWRFVRTGDVLVDDADVGVHFGYVEYDANPLIAVPLAIRDPTDWVFTAERLRMPHAAWMFGAFRGGGAAEQHCTFGPMYADSRSPHACDPSALDALRQELLRQYVCEGPWATLHGRGQPGGGGGGGGDGGGIKCTIRMLPVDEQRAIRQEKQRTA